MHFVGESTHLEQGLEQERHLLVAESKYVPSGHTDTHWKSGVR